MKSEILQLLKSSPDVISGEELSQQLRVSRVTVWKHIKALQELGYDIVSGPKGYSYREGHDFLHPWEFEGRQEKIHFFKSLPSTMGKAKEMAREGAPDQSVIIADAQLEGRGRMQRTWFSESGGLYFTLILRPQIPASSAFLMNFITSTALVETVRSQTGLDARVKWPNDILLGEKKLSGMLSEMEATEDLVAFVNIGIGLNVNNDPSSDEARATSLAIELGRPVRRREILTEFLQRLELSLADLRLEAAVQEWKKYTMTLGRQVKIVTLRETAEGRAVDIDDSGALILEDASGARKKIIYGDCFHL